MSKSIVAVSLVVAVVATFCLLPALQMSPPPFISTVQPATRGLTVEPEILDAVDDKGGISGGAATAEEPRWRGLIVVNYVSGALIREPMELQVVRIDEVYRSERGMTEGRDILGDDEEATLTAVLDKLTADNRPTFVHIVAHGCMDKGIPKIRLADGLVGADEFVKEENFEGIQLVFINTCYALASVDQEKYNFGRMFIENGVCFVIGPTGAPWDYAAAFVGVLFWALLISYKESGVPITMDNLDARIADALTSCKSLAAACLDQSADNVGTLISILVGLAVGIITGAASSPSGPGALIIAAVTAIVTGFVFEYVVIDPLTNLHYLTNILPSVEMYKFLQSSHDSDGKSGGDNGQDNDSGSGGFGGGLRPGLVLDPPGGGTISVLPL